MLKVMVECRNVRIEKVAKCLSKLTDGFKLWIHDKAVYALCDIGSLPKLQELSERLKRIKNIEFRFIKIGVLENHETRRSKKHSDRRTRRRNPRKDA